MNTFQLGHRILVIELMGDIIITSFKDKRLEERIFNVNDIGKKNTTRHFQLLISEVTLGDSDFNLFLGRFITSAQTV